LILTIQRLDVHAPDPLEGLKLIDGDSHLNEPPDLWTARAPSSIRDRMPIQKTIDGMTSWFVGDELWATTGGNCIEVGGRKRRGHNAIHPFEMIDPAFRGTKERLAFLDAAGVWAQILYPNGIGFASNHIFAIEDETDRAAIIMIYNDYLVEVQDESSNRLFPQALLPIWDMDLTVSEISRLLDAGIKGFTLTDKPELLGLAELPDSYFDPMWDLCNESGAVVNFHVGAGFTKLQRNTMHRSVMEEASPMKVSDPIFGSSLAPAWKGLTKYRQVIAASAQMHMSNIRVLANLCVSDLFDRYPRLKIASVESGIGWVPFILELLEYQYDELIVDRPGELSFAKERPRHYFDEHIYLTFWFEQSAPRKLLDEIGVDKVLVETDLPHETCLYPNPRERLGAVLKDLDFEVRRRLIQDNAVDLYGISLDPVSSS
jgi:predicted TIM-barrel fold metal-dependent hydrolase